MKYLLLVIFASVFFGCSSTTTTITKKEIPVKVPDIKDTSIAIVKTDSEETKKKVDSILKEMPKDAVLESNSVIVDTETGRETNIKTKVKLGNKNKTTGKPEPVIETIIKQDPLKVEVQEKEIIKKESTWDKLIIIGSLILVIVVIIILWKIFRKK